MMRLSVFISVLLLASCGSGRDTPIDPFSATAENDASSLAAFLNAGGDANALNQRGDSLLYVATGPHGGTAVLELLLESGANPNLGSHGYTPLMNATSWCSPKAVRLLIDAGADLSIKNDAGQSALDTVCTAGSGREEVVSILHESGI